MENPNAPSADEHLSEVHYERTKEQDVFVGCRAVSALSAFDVRMMDGRLIVEMNEWWWGTISWYFSFVGFYYFTHSYCTQEDDEEEEKEKEQPPTKEPIKCPQEEAPEPNWNFQAEVGFFFFGCTKLVTYSNV